MTTTQPEPGPRPDPAPDPDDPATATDTDAGRRRLVTTTVNTPRQDTGRHAAPEPAPGDAAERGSLSIEDGVVEKVAVAAVMEIEHVGGAARRVLGVAAGREKGGGRPQVAARVSGQVAGLDVRLAVVYPASVRATTEAVRAHLRDRVHALTELTVTRVDITVAVLSSAKAAGGKRVVA